MDWTLLKVSRQGGKQRQTSLPASPKLVIVGQSSPNPATPNITNLYNFSRGCDAVTMHILLSETLKGTGAGIAKTEKFALRGGTSIKRAPQRTGFRSLRANGNGEGEIN
ncbi:hypothetical protein PABG_00812 [Paracoccidioides brasiliensis Pb03]|nr:hypothetical protein PABG_00812 [Paracoccidioides brasiliensis Pb03]